mgnify:FL=1
MSTETADAQATEDAKSSTHRRSRRAIRKAERAAEREAILTGQQPLLTRRELRRLREEAAALRAAVESGEITAEQARALQDPLAEQPVIPDSSISRSRRETAASAPEATGRRSSSPSASSAPGSGWTTGEDTGQASSSTTPWTSPRRDPSPSLPTWTPAPARSQDEEDSEPDPTLIDTGLMAPAELPDGGASLALQSAPPSTEPPTAPMRRSLHTRREQSPQVASPPDQTSSPGSPSPGSPSPESPVAQGEGGQETQQADPTRVVTGLAQPDRQEAQAPSAAKDAPTPEPEPAAQETSIQRLRPAVEKPDAPGPESPTRVASAPEPVAKKSAPSASSGSSAAKVPYLGNGAPMRRPIVRIPAAAQGVRTVNASTGELSEIQPVDEDFEGIDTPQWKALHPGSGGEAASPEEALPASIEPMTPPEPRSVPEPAQPQPTQAEPVQPETVQQAPGGLSLPEIEEHTAAAWSEVKVATAPSAPPAPAKRSSRLGRILLIALLVLVVVLVAATLIWVLSSQGNNGALGAQDVPDWWPQPLP